MVDHGGVGIMAVEDDVVSHRSSRVCDRAIRRQRVCDCVLLAEVGNTASSTSAPTEVTKEK